MSILMGFVYALVATAFTMVAACYAEDLKSDWAKFLVRLAFFASVTVTLCFGIATWVLIYLESVL